MKTIHIFWKGPFTIKAIEKFNNSNTDFGICQEYGYHPVYRRDVLLYIGQTNDQTFSTRLKQEKWDRIEGDSERIERYPYSFENIQSRNHLCHVSASELLADETWVYL